MRKRIFSLLALLTFVGGIAFAYDTDGNTSRKREIDGAPATFPYREYQLVRYSEEGSNQSPLSAGDVVVGDSVSDDGISVGLVGTAGSSDSVKGVVVSATIPTRDVLGLTSSSDFGRRNWGYIQVKGFCSTVNVSSGNANAGTTLIASGTLPRYATAAHSSVFVGERQLGWAYDASAGGGGNKVEINL